MDKIAEMFDDDWSGGKLDGICIQNAIERLESRIDALETNVANLSEKHNRVEGWNATQDDRISALEKGKAPGIYQPIPVPVNAREWIELHTWVWVYTKQGTVNHLQFFDAITSLDTKAIMQCYPGDTAPEAPESEA